MKGMEGENYEKACQAHPERFQNISSAINQIGEEWNPRLHLILHSIVLNQMEEVEEVKETFDKLKEEHGLHPHSAIHALSAILGEEIFNVLKEKKELDSASQKEDLKALLNPNSKEHQNYVEPLTDGNPPEHPETN